MHVEQVTHDVDGDLLFYIYVVMSYHIPTCERGDLESRSARPSSLRNNGQDPNDPPETTGGIDATLA